METDLLWHLFLLLDFYLDYGLFYMSANFLLNGQHLYGEVKRVCVVVCLGCYKKIPQTG